MLFSKEWEPSTFVWNFLKMTCKIPHGVPCEIPELLNFQNN